MAPAPDPADAAHMRRALELAARGWGRVAPNPLVGAVIVRDGEVVGEGWHAEYGRAHAEVEALQQAGERARGSTAYVTLEPCSHFGKTPPCADALLEAGVRRVVFACRDPNPRAEGGAERLRRAGVEVSEGVEEEPARDLNAPFFHAHSAEGLSRPWVELKLALSLDSAVADRDGRSAWITGEAARAEVHRRRAAADGIAVGVGTVLADDPLLTVRGEVRPRRAPARIVFDRALRTPIQCRLVSTTAEAPVWIVCGPGAPDAARDALEARGVRILEADGLGSAMRRLREEGVGALFCEGGATLGAALLTAGAVDRLTLFYAPLFLGQGARGAFEALPGSSVDTAPRWRLRESRVLGRDTMISLCP